MNVSILLYMAPKLKLHLALKECTNGAKIVRVIGMSSGLTVKTLTFVQNLDRKITKNGGKHGVVKMG